MSFPLTGLKVLDFSRVLAGPFAGRMLGDLGADVDEARATRRRCNSRHWGVKRSGISGYYHQQKCPANATFQWTCANLKGVMVAESLVAEADVVIENFRRRYATIGLNYDTLAEINPRLIMLSISGFGADNADSHRAAYAPIIHAETGLIARQAELTKAFPTELRFP